MPSALLSPTFLDVRMANPAYWATKQTAASSTVYPSGIISVAPDAVDVDWDPGITIAEADSVTRLTVTNPGGFDPGGSVIYAYVFHPVATLSGRCDVLFCGHAGLFDVYCDDDGSSVVRRGLANGDVVIGVDMNNYGRNPVQVVVIGGVTYTCATYGHHWEHFPGLATPAVTAYDTPKSFMRLILDHPAVAMKWVEDNLGIHKFAVIGHSGGAASAIALSAVDSRIGVAHILQCPFFIPDGLTSAACWGSCSGSDLALACQFSAFAGPKDILNVAASYPNRKTVLWMANHDEWANTGGENVSAAYQVATWRDRIEKSNAWIDSSTGGLSSISFREKTTGPAEGNHNIDSDQAAWVAAHIAENL